jgi:hypothetical protein
VERRLWSDGGYYVDNGAALCAEHHLKAETTELSCERIREAAGITKIVLPDHLEPDQKYDKWGNPELPNGMRMRGELFADPSVQLVLKDYLHLFTNRCKYPRTFHLPWSPGLGKGDRVIENMSAFLADERVIVTRKMDGESTSMYADGLHARSLDFHTDVRRDWIRAFHAQIAHEIPENWRLCGENLFAKHSIAYDNLASYFFGFSVWNEKNACLPWDETIEWFKLLGIESVPVLYDGEYRGFLKDRERFVDPEHEGYVIRLSCGFSYRDFRRCVAKYVRKDHVQTSEHWKSGPVVKNRLAGVKP